MKKMLAVALAFTLISTTAFAAEGFEKEPAGEEILLDALLLRPVGLATIFVGTAAFVVTLPFTVPAGGVGLAGRKFIVEPFKFTFTRPIGTTASNY